MHPPATVQTEITYLLRYCPGIDIPFPLSRVRIETNDGVIYRVDIIEGIQPEVGLFFPHDFLDFMCSFNHRFFITTRVGLDESRKFFEAFIVPRTKVETGTFSTHDVVLCAKEVTLVWVKWNTFTPTRYRSIVNLRA